MLLRQLEHGKGPGIEIAWPETPELRRRLHILLTKCHGMRAALMSADGRLYVADGTPGVPWHVDMDRTSGFLRQVFGVMTSVERTAVARISAHHGREVTGSVVRLFPRAVDADLLGSFHALGELDYGASQSITAAYSVDGARVRIGDIRINGKPVDSVFELPRIVGRCR